MLSAISWVPRGAARPFPKTAELDEEEVAEVRRRAEGVAASAAAAAADGDGGDAEAGEERGDVSDEDAAMEEEEEEDEDEGGEANGEEAAEAAAAFAAEIRKAKKGQSADDRLADELAELDMDHYDDEGDSAPNLFGTGKGIGAAYYRSNEEDPYLTKTAPGEEDDEEEEIEDLTIRDTDLLILAARNEDDVSFIEVWVCEEQQRAAGGDDDDDIAENDKELNLYVHHDVMLPAFPLALAWMDFNPASAAAASASSSASAGAAAIAAVAGGASILAPGNFVAVATMDPAIEIWDLDVLDEVEPAASLGGFVGAGAGGAGGDGEEEDEEGEWEEVEEEMGEGGGGKGSKSKKGKKAKGGKKGKKSKGQGAEAGGGAGRSSKKGKTGGKTAAAGGAAVAVLKEGSHKGAVMALSWNREYRSVLASGGEDRRVKVWDMASQRCERTLKPHTGKVQAVAWAPLLPTTLLSGSFDRSLALMDVRAPDATVLRWGVSADVEALAWDPHDSSRFVVSSEDGLICCHDTRAASSNASAVPSSISASPGVLSTSALFTIHAHTKAACTVSWNPKIPHLLASGSTDKTVKLWDLTGNQARCLESSNPKLGAVFSVAFCADAPRLLAMGGSKGKLKLWDTSKVADLHQRLNRVV